MYNMVLQPNGNILVNGLINENGYQSFEVARLIAAAPTAVKQINNGTEFSVFPNPTGGELRFEWSKNPNGRISVCNLTGNVVLLHNCSNELSQTLDMGSIAAGVYLVTYQDNETITTKRIVKQ